jgi:ElaB/YqjD/DUF883 family membrane-anchored ribosome-binding protein
MVQDGGRTESGAAGSGAAAAAGAADLRRDVDAIRADLAALREDLSALVGGAVRAGKARAGDASQRFTDAARSRLDQMGSAWEGVGDRGQELLDQAQQRIGERPLQSVGIAFAVGLLVGAAARR